jgi:hypothetical protein
MLKTTYVTLKITYDPKTDDDPREYWDSLVDDELSEYLGLDYNESIELYSVTQFPPRKEF